jgi:phosphohistidine phosphatase
MRRLMMLRHAKSDLGTPGMRDQDRVLAERGRESAPRIGSYMTRHALRPDLIVASTATRVRQTLDLVLPAFPKPPRIVYDDRLYEVEAEGLLEVVKETPGDVHALLLVGHNPGLAELAAHLVGTGDVETRQKLLEKFPTAGLAVVDLAVPGWGEVARGSGSLERFVTPRSLGWGEDE